MAANSLSYPTDPLAARHARAAAVAYESGANIPILTFGLIVFLVLVFGIELRCAAEIDGAGPIGINSLIAFGAAGYDRVFADHEYWRAFLAPLLHANYSHLIGNVIALFFVGIKLEPLVGKAWFAAIFVLGAIGGIAASLIGNPHEVVTVGASGAISGLIGALFAGSFSGEAAHLDQRAMRLSALRFGLPALAPLLYGAAGHSHTDYHAHLGGALVGATVVAALCTLAAAGRPRPIGAATGISVCGLAASLVALACAIQAYGGSPVGRIAATAWRTSASSEAFPLNYQTDPRARIVRALALHGRGKVLAAEIELRNAMALAGKEAGNRDLQDFARTLLAIVVFKNGRRWEAWRTASDLCGGAGHADNRRMLQKAGVCD